MRPISLKRLGNLTAAITMLLGLLFFIIFNFFSSQSTFHLFLWYVFVSFCVNIFVLMLLVLSKNRKSNLGTIGFMLINAPFVLFLFIWFIVITVNSLRVDFVNKTTSEITDIRIYGCESKHITQIKPGEVKTIWFRIDKDCSLTTNYLKDGERFQETIINSATNGTSGRGTFYLGESNPMYFHH